MTALSERSVEAQHPALRVCNIYTQEYVQTLFDRVDRAGAEQGDQRDALLGRLANAVVALDQGLQDYKHDAAIVARLDRTGKYIMWLVGRLEKLPRTN